MTPEAQAFSDGYAAGRQRRPDDDYDRAVAADVAVHCVQIANHLLATVATQHSTMRLLKRIDAVRLPPRWNGAPGSPTRCCNPHCG